MRWHFIRIYTKLHMRKLRGQAHWLCQSPGGLPPLRQARPAPAQRNQASESILDEERGRAAVPHPIEGGGSAASIEGAGAPYAHCFAIGLSPLFPEYSLAWRIRHTRAVLAASLTQLFAKSIRQIRGGRFFEGLFGLLRCRPLPPCG